MMEIIFCFLSPCREYMCATQILLIILMSHPQGDYETFVQNHTISLVKIDIKRKKKRFHGV